jgi:putative CocE/NonD family hydrolase
VAIIPGQGLPMENDVFLDVNYGWAFYVTDGPLDDDKVYFDPDRWRRLSSRWFQSGRPFREIDAVDGTPNPLLQRWLAHPSFDGYWQAMVPWADDFARIDIPVLSITGYYDDAQISALRYFTEHVARRKGAEHYLLIGPWDHFGAQRRPAPVLRGYAVDDVARTDNSYVTFAWLDHVLRGGPKPAILADRVNWEVMGANEWRHAPSIDAMHDRVLTFYLDAHRMTAAKPALPGVLEQVVDLADRTTQNNSAYYPDPIVRDALDDGHGVVFESDPFDAPTSIDGTLSGAVRVVVDRKDFDLGVVLYEKTAEGKYFALTYYLGRASYARDLTTRTLLVPGAVTTIPFERTRMVSRMMAKGSRLVVVLNVNKNEAAQVNCGTGKDVSDESAADCGPLHVKWLGDSWVAIPVGR